MEEAPQVPVRYPHYLFVLQYSIIIIIIIFDLVRTPEELFASLLETLKGTQILRQRVLHATLQHLLLVKKESTPGYASTIIFFCTIYSLTHHLL